MRTHNYEYDAFISHAVEDKIPIANELCSRLERAGLRIWYSGKELGIGDSIEKTIQKGLHRSRYGIVIFSPTYLAKNWTIREFYTLLAKEIEEHKVILPVLYNVTLDDLKNKDLLMADRFAVNSERGMDFVVERLVKEIRKTNVVAEKKQFWMARLWFFFFASLFLNLVFLLKDTGIFQGRPEVLPVSAAAFAPLQGHATQSFFDEIGALLRNAATCTCGGRSMHTAPDYDLSLSGEVFPGSAPHHHPRSISSEGVAGRKVTMAVILQMDMEGQQASGVNRDTESLFSAVSMASKGQPVSAGTEAHRMHRAGCLAVNCSGD